MKRQVLLVVFALFAFSLYSQSPRNLLLLTGDTLFRNSTLYIEVYADAAYRSNSLSNELMNAFLFGGYIDEEAKSFSSDRLDSKNRTGLEASAGMRFFNFSDSLFRDQRWGLHLQVESRVDAQFLFSEDLFRLGMFGNAGFAGQQARLDQSSANYQFYQKMGIGLFHKSSFSGITLSFVNGQSYFDAQVDSGSLFTSAEGDSLSLELMAELAQSDTAKTGFGTGNGAGMCLDFNWNLPLLDGKGFLLIGVEDLGFIHWTSASMTDRYNTVYSYTGAQIGDLYDSENVLQFPSPADSLAKESEKAAFTTWMPARVRLGILHKLGKRSYYELAIRAKVQKDYIPEVHGGFHYMLSNRLLVSTFAGYGGYGGFRAGLGVDWMPGGSWYVQVKSNDVPGLFSKSLFGRHFEVKLAKFIGS